MRSPAEWGAIVLGVLLIVNGLLWRQLHLRRKRRSQHAGLEDPDPEVRAATVEAMTAGGLSGHAAALEELIKTEQDPAVLDAVAQAVFRNQWEPASVPAMIQLRIWASNRTPSIGGPEEFVPEPASPGEPATAPMEEPRSETPTDWPVAPVVALEEYLAARPEPEPEPMLEPEPLLGSAESEPALEPEPVLDLAATEPEPVTVGEPVWEEQIRDEPAEPVETLAPAQAVTALAPVPPEPDLEPLGEHAEPAPDEIPDELVLTPLTAPLFNPPPAVFDPFEPASPELVAASEVVADAIAQVLGTTVRSLRITTLEGVVTAQWPR